MRKLLVILVALVVLAGACWFALGRAAGPSIEIVSPTTAIGQNGELIVLVEAPNGNLSQLDVALEQGANRYSVYEYGGAADSTLTGEGDGRLLLTYPIGQRHTPELQAGNARLVVTAARPVFGIREVSSTVTRDVEVRLTPPKLAVLSMQHYVNYGGSEVVVYTASPADVTSGVRVGEVEWPGYPAAGAGIPNADPALRVAFFAVLWNQEPDVPISVFARDDVGNEASTALEHRVFPKVFRNSRITIDDPFLAKVVPEILQNSTELRVENPADQQAAFLRINRDLRRMNDSTIAAYAAQTSDSILWQGAFRQLSNTAVEAGFADRRTYVYNGNEIDQQTHLGFDLASTARAPVQAANSGRVVHAGWLGIYGNCVILDHGMGLQSLYAHLSSIDVAVGDMVEMNATLGRTGATGMAGGDHLHFTMLLGGRAITPIDWWSAQWVNDRIMRKLRAAGGGTVADSTAVAR